MQNFSSFGLELTELQPLEALWMRPKVFPLVYWKLAKLCLGNIEETRTEPEKKNLSRFGRWNPEKFNFENLWKIWQTQLQTDTPPIEAANRYAAAA